MGHDSPDNPDADADEPEPASGPRARIPSEALDHLPDVRDGLTRLQRVILWQLGELERERKGRMVPSAMLYGRVVEHVDVSPEKFMAVLAKLTGKGQSGN